MADFAPPGGPPPPKVPEGWKALWNDQYSEWFYVNLQTRKSTWDKPTAPAYASSSAEPPSGAPPSYVGQGPTGPEKSSLHSNNPYNSQTSQSTLDEDARLAAQLQAEEDARARGSGGARPTSRNAQNDYENTGTRQGYGQQDLPPREQKHSSGLGGLFSKLTGKHSGGSHQSQGSQAQYQQGGYGYPPQGYSQGYQQQSYGGYPPQQQGYGYGPPQGGGYGGYGGGYGQPPRRAGGGGMGMAGGAALGLGAGLIGGALVADAIDDDHDDYGDGGGGDYGGGDDGGGGD